MLLSAEWSAKHLIRSDFSQGATVSASSSFYKKNLSEAKARGSNTDMLMLCWEAEVFRFIQKRSVFVWSRLQHPDSNHVPDGVIASEEEAGADGITSDRKEVQE